MSKSRTALTAALDIGTSKVCCLIADTGGDGAPRVVGIGHQVADGVKAGSIVDMEAARNAVRAAVHAAEEMADATISEVFVNVSTGRPRSTRFDAEVPVAGHEVGPADMRRVIDNGRQWKNGETREIIHAIPVSFTLDGDTVIRDPRGMVADRLGVDMHLVTATASAVRNLTNCIAGCHLEVTAMVASPFAAGLGCLTQDEIELGVAVIDLGAGTTTIATFEERELVFTAAVPVGGAHVTNDIAHGLSTPIAEAERLKTLHGTTFPASSDARRLLDVPTIAGETSEEPNQVSRSQLAGVVKPRIEETLELVRDRLDQDGPGKAAARRLVLTGGASQLEGLRDVSSEIFDAQVRFGRPARFAGLADAVAGPAFSVAAGLLHFATTRHEGRATPRRRRSREAGGLFGRLGNWLHENF